MTLTLASITEEIKTDLGYPTVKVELDAAVYSTIVNKAMRWFTGKKGVIAQIPIPLVESIDEYDWPANATTIVEVIIPRRSDISDILTLGFFDIVPASTISSNAIPPISQAGGTLRFDVSSYVQLLQNLEIRRRVFSADPDWIEDIARKKIILTNRNPVAYSISGSALSMIVRYKINNPSLSDFFGRDEELFYRYCLAKAKIILGTTRSKYGSYPAAGGPINMDGDALKTEGFAELAVLDDEIIESQGNAGGIVQG